jgi:16S rRNA G966 N2-methylase RsmD
MTLIFDTMEINTAFITAHLNEDPQKLLLAAHRYPDVNMRYVAAQLTALAKVKDKIPSWYNPAFQFPAALSIEQASSEATARFKASLFQGLKMIDLTGGMGVDAFFWSNSFKNAIYLEQNEVLVAAAKHNFKTLEATNIACIQTTAEDFLSKNKDNFDLIYLDPARRDDQKRKVFLLEDCQPDIVALKETLLQCSPKVLVKTAPLLDLKSAMLSLKYVTQVWVVSVKNECKEVLYLLENQSNLIENIPIHAVTLGSEQRIFTTTIQAENEASSEFSAPLQYLYEPDAAVMKAGAFKTFGTQFGLKKLNLHTHLFTSENLVENLPARVFKIEAVCKYDKKTIQSHLNEPKANIATRNFVDTPEEMRKKLNLKEGGVNYIFGVTNMVGRQEVLVCSRG